MQRLTEVRAARGERRWYTCDSADLYVWQDPNGEPRAFELCYDKIRGEHAVRWRRGAGTDHVRIDDGEADPLRNATPIAVADGRLDAAAVALRFEAVGAGVEPRIYRQVLRALHGAPASP